MQIKEKQHGEREKERVASAVDNKTGLSRAADI